MIYIGYTLEEISMKENIDVTRMRNVVTQPTTLCVANILPGNVG